MIDQQPIQSTQFQFPQKIWRTLIPQEYVIPTTPLELSGEQVTKLLEAQSQSHLQVILTPDQQEQFRSALARSCSGSLYAKVNGRTAKDLPFVARQLYSVGDLLTLLHSSEYVLEPLQKGRPTEVLLREYSAQLADNLHIFQVFVRGGTVIAIGQKFRDHVEAEPDIQTQEKLIEVCQKITPTVSLIAPIPLQPNSFMATIYINGSTLKVLSLHQYPHRQAYTHSLFSQKELQGFYKEVRQGQHRSNQNQYLLNGGVVALVRTVSNKADVQTYDMGEYLMGNEIEGEQMLGEWKNFLKQAEEYL